MKFQAEVLLFLFRGTILFGCCLLGKELRFLRYCTLCMLGLWTYEGLCLHFWLL
jgi:hypothetical protein